jgi:uncharacterized Ntn-hydrolase superfamily protein
MMLNDKVTADMEKAWNLNAGKRLPERIVEVLKAAQLAGGDIRGKQSAALLVVKPRSTGKIWEDRYIDLRVDDHVSPILELERLLKVFRAYEYMNEGDLLMENKDMNGAMTAYNAAMKLFPQNLEMKYWTAITLANNKETDKAISLLKKIYAKDANWRELTKRIRKVGLLTVSDTDFAKLIQ